MTGAIGLFWSRIGGSLKPPELSDKEHYLAVVAVDLTRRGRESLIIEGY
jgi:hypothetical protein